MRVLLSLRLEHVPARLPINLNYEQTSLLYRLIHHSSPEFAHFLHERGYSVAPDDAKRFKLFCYSRLLVPPQQRRIGGALGDMMEITTPHITWIIASPVDELLQHLVTGLFAGGLRLGRTLLQLETAETIESPDFTTHAARGTVPFTCLSPLLISRPAAPGSPQTTYLTPADAVGFSEGVRRNLLFKYTAHHGQPPRDDRLELRFNERYLERQRERGKNATCLVDFKGSKLRGVLCPFTLSGSPELMAFGYDCGYGEKNSMGFGLAEVEK